MSETRASANARMACLECGVSGAAPYVTTKGANPGRMVRVCDRDLPGWSEYGLRERKPIEGEGVDPPRATIA